MLPYRTSHDQCMALAIYSNKVGVYGVYEDDLLNDHYSRTFAHWEVSEMAVKEVLTGLRMYLHSNLRIDKDFIADLSAAGLLSASNADSLRSSVTQGGNEALYGLLHYIEWYYDEEMLEKFCVFLDDCSQKAKPRLREVAARIRSELEK